MSFFLIGATLASPIDKGLINIFRYIGKEHGVVRTHVGIHTTFLREDWKTIEGILLSSFEDNLFAIDLDKSVLCTVLEYGHLQSVDCSKVNPFVCYKRDVAATHLTACGTEDEGYKYNKNTGHCYKFHPEANTWMRAFGICFAEKGYLSIVNSWIESIVLRDIFQRNVGSVINGHDLSYAHMGFIDWDKNGMWRTIDGKSLENSGFWDWDYGEPNNLQAGEHCGSINISNGRLNDKFCDQKLHFICEKDVENKILG